MGVMVGTPTKRIKVEQGVSYSPEFLQDVADAILMCLAEAGYPARMRPDESQLPRNLGWLEGDAIPWDVFYRAQAIVFDRFGVPYEWVDA